jgi:ribose transport system permease protein
MSELQSQTAAPPAAAARTRKHPLDYLIRFQSLPGLILVMIGGMVFSPRRHGQILFVAPDNIANIVRSISETGILALGMTFVIIAAGIDLSVGAVLGLASVLTASLLVNGGWGLAATLPLVLVVGAAFGLIQGALSTSLRIQAFIVTLAGLQAARGLALIASDNKFININYGEGPGNAPPAFAVLGERLFGDTFPVATLVFLVLAVIATFVLNSTRYGRYVFAVGGNERAARLSGIPVGWMKVSVYGLSGLCAAIAGIVHAGQFSSAAPMTARATSSTPSRPW